jgi:hypothetical protein
MKYLQLLNHSFVFRWVVPLVACAFALCIRLPFINLRDITLDEPFTIFHAQQSVSHIWLLPFTGEPNPPLFMLLLHYWIGWFGIEPMAVRSLPLLFGCITVFFVYRTALQTAGQIAAIMSAVLICASSVHIYFSLEARTYSLVSMGAAMALFFYTQLTSCQKDSRWWLVGLICSNFILVYSHYFGWFVLLNEAIITIIFYRSRNIFLKMLVVFIVTLIGYIPIVFAVIKQFGHSAKGTWVKPPQDGQLLNELYQWSNSSMVAMVFCCIIFVGVLILIYKAKKYHSLPTTSFKPFVVFLLWAAIPFTFMYVVSFRIPIFLDRYILFNSIPFYLATATLLSYVYNDVLYVKVGAVSIVLLLFIKSTKIGSHEYYWRDTKAAVAQTSLLKTPETLVLLDPGWQKNLFAYHYNRSFFRQYDKLDSLLKSDNIESIWNAQQVNYFLEMYPNKTKIVLFEDGSDGSVRMALDSLFEKTDSSFYEQCLYVSSYQRRK